MGLPAAPPRPGRDRVHPTGALLGRVHLSGFLDRMSRGQLELVRSASASTRTSGRTSPARALLAARSARLGGRLDRPRAPGRALHVPHGLATGGRCRRPRGGRRRRHPPHAPPAPPARHASHAGRPVPRRERRQRAVGRRRETHRLAASRQHGRSPPTERRRPHGRAAEPVTERMSVRGRQHGRGRRRRRMNPSTADTPPPGDVVERQRGRVTVGEGVVRRPGVPGPGGLRCARMVGTGPTRPWKSGSLPAHPRRAVGGGRRPRPRPDVPRLPRTACPSARSSCGCSTPRDGPAPPLGRSHGRGLLGHLARRLRRHA